MPATASMLLSQSTICASRWSVLALDWLISILRNTLKHLQNYAKVTQLYRTLSRLNRLPNLPLPDHPVRAKHLIIAGLFLLAPYSYAEELDVCATALTSLPDDTLLSDSVATSEHTIVFEVGEVEAQFGADPTANMGGGVLLRRGDKHAGANAASYDPTNRSFTLEGDVRYRDAGTQVDSDLAEFGYDSGSVRFEGAEFSLGSSNARGAAEVLHISEEGTLQLDAVSYTTCPPNSNDWLIEARDIDIDTNEGVGIARGMKLRFQGVPILYAPYLLSR